MEDDDYGKNTDVINDDDELMEFEIDSEAAQNTNANVQATRPSISMEKYGHHDGNYECLKARTSAIRFQGKLNKKLFSSIF